MSQQTKLENYLWNHFQNGEKQLKYQYLMTLYKVVDRSTVCLMNHERQQTLSLIECLAYQVSNDEQMFDKTQTDYRYVNPQTFIYSNGFLYPAHLLATVHTPLPWR